jgi:predicted MPP superfamily phosphohydrolase
MIAFLLVMTTLLGGMGFYLGTRLIPPSWTPKARALAWVGVVAIIAMQPLAFITMRFIRPSFADAVGWIGFSLMGFFLLTLTLLLMRDVGWLGGRITNTLPDEPGRRAALLGATNAGVLALAGGLWAFGFARTRGVPSIVHVTVPIANLPSGLEGFTIAQISDVHVGPTIKRGFIESIVAEINKLEADVVAVTGDIVDGAVSELREHTAPFADLRARHGVFFVTGNHEYYSGALPWMEEMKRLGMTVLENAHHVIDKAGHALVMAGVTDISGHQMVPHHKSDPHKALEGAPEGSIKVLLAHQPRSAYAAQKAGFHLQLSGHTHGGQFFPGTLLVHLVQPFVAGLHRLEDMWVYTNRGTGYWGPPIRHNDGGEITKITLTRA